MPNAMNNRSSHIQRPDRSQRRRIILGGCCASPVLALLIVYILYLAHNRTPHIDLPTHTVPADNAIPIVENCFAASKAMVHPAPSISGQRTYSAYADCAADAEPMLKLLHEAISHPLVNPPVRSHKDDPFRTLAAGRDTFRTINSVASYYELSKDPDRAMQIRLDGLELAVMMARGGTLITESMSSAYETLTWNRMELLIPHLTDAQLAATASQLELIQSKRTPTSDLIIEDSYETTARLLETLHEKGKFDNPMADLDAMGTAATAMPVKERLRVRYESAKFDLTDKTNLLKTNLEWTRTLAAEMRAGYRVESAVPVPQNLYSELYTGLYKNAERQALANKTVVDILRIEVALEQYRRANSAFPASLDKLTPRFLNSLPTDPFNPAGYFTYAMNPDATYTLYSYGTDAKDNGGTPGRYTAIGDGDIVAGWLRPTGYPPIIGDGK